MANSQLLVVAGSETTATLLSTALYLLTTSPRALAKLNIEIRSAYENEGDIDLLNTQNLTYLNAVINESLRIHPPVPGSGPRVTAPGGSIIAGVYIPQNVSMDTQFRELILIILKRPSLTSTCGPSTMTRTRLHCLICSFLSAGWETNVLRTTG